MPYSSSPMNFKCVCLGMYLATNAESTAVFKVLAWSVMSHIEVWFFDLPLALEEIQLCKQIQNCWVQNFKCCQLLLRIKWNNILQVLRSNFSVRSGFDNVLKSSGKCLVWGLGSGIALQLGLWLTEKWTEVDYIHTWTTEGNSMLSPVFSFLPSRFPAVTKSLVQYCS